MTTQKHDIPHSLHQWESTNELNVECDIHIVIPVDSLEDMSDEEIATAVRSVALQAQVACACDWAAYILTNPGNAEYYDEIWHRRAFRVAAPIPMVSKAIALIKAARETAPQPRLAEIQDTRRAQAGYIYILKSDHGYKIGRSKDVPSRTKAIGTQMPFPFELIHIIECDDYVESETYLHGLFAAKRLNGEWFNLSDTDVAWLLRLQANCAEPVDDTEQSQ